MSVAPENSRTVPSRAIPMSTVDGLGSDVLPMPYHMAPMPTPSRSGSPARCRRRVERLGLGAQRDPARLERVQARGEPGARREDLPGPGRRARAQGVPAPDLELVEAELRGQVVEQRLVRDRRLGHAEAAERAGGRPVRVDGGRRGLDGRHGVRAHRVDGDAVGHRGTPRGVGAGVEVAVEADAGEPAVGVGAERRLDPRRVALRRRLHRLRPRVHAADRAAGDHRGDREQRLDRQVELAAEAAAAGARDDPDGVLRQAEDERELVAIHVRRLGRRPDLDPPVDDARGPGLGLDVRVLHERRLERAGRGDRRRRRAPRPRRRARGGRGRGRCPAGRRGAAAPPGPGRPRSPAPAAARST